MSQRWDYSPILERHATETEFFAAVLAICQCGEKLTAVRSTLEQCDRRIKRKYRRHARQLPIIHPVPELVEAQESGWTSGACA